MSDIPPGSANAGKIAALFCSIESRAVDMFLFRIYFLLLPMGLTCRMIDVALFLDINLHVF